MAIENPGFIHQVSTMIFIWPSDNVYDTNLFNIGRQLSMLQIDFDFKQKKNCEVIIR